MKFRQFWQQAKDKLWHEAENPHKVALGVAIGVGISFVPLPGFGAILAIVGAWLVRGSIPAALVAQVVGNPWTFPFIWAASLAVGRVIIPLQNGTDLTALMNNLDWQFVLANQQDLIMNILVPLALGGLILGFVFGVLTYAVVLWEMRRLLLKYPHTQPKP